MSGTSHDVALGGPRRSHRDRHGARRRAFSSTATGTKMPINDRGEISGHVWGRLRRGSRRQDRQARDRQRTAGTRTFRNRRRRGLGDRCAVRRSDRPPGTAIGVWAIARDGARAVEVTLLKGPRAGAKLVVTPGGGRFGSLGSAEGDTHLRCLFPTKEVPAMKPLDANEGPDSSAAGHRPSVATRRSTGASRSPRARTCRCSGQDR